MRTLAQAPFGRTGHMSSRALFGAAALGGVTQTEADRATWYKPFEEQADYDASIHWAMQVEGSFINTTGDVELLEKALKAVASYSGPPSDEEVRARAEAGGWETLFPSRAPSP